METKRSVKAMFAIAGEKWLMLGGGNREERQRNI